MSNHLFHLVPVCREADTALESYQLGFVYAGHKPHNFFEKSPISGTRRPLKSGRATSPPSFTTYIKSFCEITDDLPARSHPQSLGKQREDKAPAESMSHFLIKKDKGKMRLDSNLSAAVDNALPSREFGCNFVRVLT